MSKCTKIFSGWGYASDPAEGALKRPPQAEHSREPLLFKRRGENGRDENGREFWGEDVDGKRWS